MQLLAMMKQSVLSTDDAIGKESPPETYSNPIILMGMKSELAFTDTFLRSDELYFQNAAIIFDYAARFEARILGLRRSTFRTHMEVPACTRRKIRMETGATMRCRFLKFTQDLDTQ